jgi:NAD-dependent SIR2 family protein deacetylase
MEITCLNCGRDMENQVRCGDHYGTGREYVYCSKCGAKMIIEYGESKREDNKKTYRYLSWPNPY